MEYFHLSDALGKNNRRRDYDKIGLMDQTPGARLIVLWSASRPSAAFPCTGIGKAAVSRSPN
jgi:hypothetical protein